MTIIKSILYANFEEPRSRDRDLGSLNLRKKLPFLSRNFINSLITINLLNVERWNLNITWVQIDTVCTPSLGTPSHVIAISEAENRQNVDNLNRCISVTTNINEKKFVFFGTCYVRPLSWSYLFIYFALDKIFPYFFFFFLLLSLSTFKPQNAHGLYCELL